MLQPIHDILKAALFAAQKHATQQRKGAAHEPYINHPLEVAELVAGALSQPDPNLVIAALLHDTVEDCDVTPEQLAQAFGPDVADLVAEVTDDKNLEKSERKRLQILNAPRKSPRAQTIKLADKISNLRGILSSPPADWTLQQKREDIDHAKQVVDGFTAPNRILQPEFERLYAQKDKLKQ